MRGVEIGVGALLILVALSDMFESVVLPRTVTRRLRLARFFYRSTWSVTSRVGRLIPWRGPREAILGAYGPLSLPMLLGLWAFLLICGFALLYHGANVRVNSGSASPQFLSHLYLSGVTFFTLGYGDIVPKDSLGRAMAVTEAGMGFGFLAIVIGYLPIIYQAFSRRESGMLVLDSRAGSPPTAAALLSRFAKAGQVEDLAPLLQQFERWAGELLESHLSYPVLAYYRSQHDRESWLGTLTAVLDACAVVLQAPAGTLPESLRWQARHTFAIARHAVIDLSLVLHVRPASEGAERLPSDEYQALQATLKESGLDCLEAGGSEAKLKKLRRLYEPYACALGERLLMELPGWIPAPGAKDNWQTSAWESEAHF